MQLCHTALLHLLQLASPALPVGAYSYSEGLETLVESGKVVHREALENWLVQELGYGAVRIEGAVMVRCYQAIQQGDQDVLNYWNQWLSAVRETEELRLQSLQMGRSLLRLVLDLEPDAKNDVNHSTLQESCHFAVAFAIAASHWQIDPSSALLGYLHSWATSLVNAGVKLIPLGQTSGQQLLQALQKPIQQAMAEIQTLEDDQLGSCGWGLALASMAHETQYSRLFRS
jgi:urease accessory protein